MSTDPSPEEIIAQRLRADPGLMQRRLDRDLGEIAALGRTGVQITPGTSPAAVVERLRSQAEQLTFRFSIEGATQTKRHLVELPAEERRAGTSFHAYHASASTTVREGAVVCDTAASDGSRALTFHRAAGDTGLATVTLSARVCVETDGAAHLDGYGWPAPPTEPVHTFSGSGQELIFQAASDLADQHVPLDRALLLLWGATLQGGTPTQGERLRIAELAAARTGEINAYLGQTDTYALMSGGEGWYGACLYRSALENLFEIYLGSLTFTLLDAEDIDDTDEELRTNLSGVRGAGTAVPEGVPVSHWWWEMATNG